VANKLTALSGSHITSLRLCRGGVTFIRPLLFASFPEMQKEAARHVAQECSTYGWIMQGLLERAGFEIISIDNCRESLSVYHSRKT